MSGNVACAACAKGCSSSQSVKQSNGQACVLEARLVIQYVAVSWHITDHMMRLSCACLLKQAAYAYAHTPVGMPAYRHYIQVSFVWDDIACLSLATWSQQQQTGTARACKRLFGSLKAYQAEDEEASDTLQPSNKSDHMCRPMAMTICLHNASSVGNSFQPQITPSRRQGVHGSGV